MPVPALNFHLIWDKRTCVPHDKRVPFDEMPLPDIFHPQSSVAHLVLKAWGVMLNRQQWLQQDRWLRNTEYLFYIVFYQTIKRIYLLPPN